MFNHHRANHSSRTFIFTLEVCCIKNILPTYDRVYFYTNSLEIKSLKFEDMYNEYCRFDLEFLLSSLK